MKQRPPFLESYRCVACHDDGRCAICHGSGRRFSLQLGNLTRGHSFRIHDLLLQVTSGGDVRARFDHWKAGQWQDVISTAGLHALLRNVIKNQKLGTGPIVFAQGWGTA